MTDKPTIGHYGTHPDVGEPIVSKSQIRRIFVQDPDRLIAEIERLKTLVETYRQHAETTVRLRRVADAAKRHIEDGSYEALYAALKALDEAESKIPKLEI